MSAPEARTIGSVMTPGPTPGLRVITVLHIHLHGSVADLIRYT